MVDLSERDVLVAVLADPQLPDAVADTTGTPPHRLLERTAELGPLPGARREAQAIAELFGPSAETYLGAAATEARVMEVGGRADVLHLGAHGFVDGDAPLDSGLVLAVAPGSRGRGRNGVLQAWEVFEQLRLDADLVVLSGCETGVGELLLGEGMMGLSRAFQYAGARSVVASLWAVRDASTAVFMSRFYERLRVGTSKDRALQRARMTLIASTAQADSDPSLERVDLSHPYHWAAFQLHGDWR